MPKVTVEVDLPSQGSSHRVVSSSSSSKQPPATPRSKSELVQEIKGIYKGTENFSVESIPNRRCKGRAPFSQDTIIEMRRAVDRLEELNEGIKRIHLEEEKNARSSPRHTNLIPAPSSSPMESEPYTPSRAGSLREKFLEQSRGQELLEPRTASHHSGGSTRESPSRQQRSSLVSSSGRVNSTTHSPAHVSRLSSVSEEPSGLSPRGSGKSSSSYIEHPSEASIKSARQVNMTEYGPLSGSKATPISYAGHPSTSSVKHSSRVSGVDQSSGSRVPSGSMEHPSMSSIKHSSRAPVGQSSGSRLQSSSAAHPSSASVKQPSRVLYIERSTTGEERRSYIDIPSRTSSVKHSSHVSTGSKLQSSRSKAPADYAEHPSISSVKHSSQASGVERSPKGKAPASYVEHPSSSSVKHSSRASRVEHPSTAPVTSEKGPSSYVEHSSNSTVRGPNKLSSGVE
ncbi:hypothetical protein TWF481_010694 [Arthrobotrys musiformis]|uniref:Uncharacterized protein n=1 Tax=Arthrobotrys musiformis TaxID=47236 RepID=A0AAV9W1N2_9PEZI